MGDVIRFEKPEPEPSLLCPCGYGIKTKRLEATCPACGNEIAFVSGCDFMDEEMAMEGWE